MKTEDLIAIFPLPNVVLFPQTNLPLHIFEPRYCQMVRETIENKQMIGIFMLQPGWQKDYYGNPPVYPVGCAGEMVYVESLPEDKFNIVLHGLHRASVIDEIQEIPYRKARVHLMSDVIAEDKKSVLETKQSLLADLRSMSDLLETLDTSSLTDLMDFSHLVNWIAMNIRLDQEVKQRLLEENDLYKRAMTLQEQMRNQLKVLQMTHPFRHLRPPDPGQN